MGRRSEFTTRSEIARCLTHALVMQLKARRLQLGLSQRDVADLMGTTQSGVSEIESLANDDIRVGTLIGYAQAVDAKIKIEVDL